MATVTRFFLLSVDPGLILWAVVVSAGNADGVTLENLEGFLEVKRTLPVKIPVRDIQRDNAFLGIVGVDLNFDADASSVHVSLRTDCQKVATDWKIALGHDFVGISVIAVRGHGVLANRCHQTALQDFGQPRFLIFADGFVRRLAVASVARVCRVRFWAWNFDAGGGSRHAQALEGCAFWREVKLGGGAVFQDFIGFGCQQVVMDLHDQLSARF